MDEISKLNKLLPYTGEMPDGFCLCSLKRARARERVQTLPPVGRIYNRQPASSQQLGKPAYAFLFPAPIL